MTFVAVILIFLLAFSASFIQRVSGFGFGIVFMTAAPYIMPTYGEATALSGMLALVCAIVTGVEYFRYIPWKKLLLILLTFLLVSYFAVHAVSHLDNRTLKHILGVILILIGLYFYLLNGKFRMKPTPATQIGMGVLSGAMGGLFGMQGPPAVIYFISCTDSKEEYMAITQWYFIIGNIAMTFYRAGNGFVTVDVGKGWLIGAGAVLLGFLAGSKVYNMVPLDRLRKIVYIFICISGIAALFA